MGKNRVRAGASEMINMASLMGGIVSQEIIKLITHQYVPLNNSLIFNGISSTGAVYEL
jgi:amyloid beta precursor protein binding protein 1